MENKIVVSLFVVVFASALAMPASATITPDTLNATLSPGECTTVNKEVYLPGHAPRVDVIFAFDLTGSMGSIISTAKEKAKDIIDKLETDYPGVDFNYGVMSYMDYPHSYSSCGYNASYGSAWCGDYAYKLNQSLTSNKSAVIAAINGLTLGCGDDGPQDYTRIMYESYADPSIGWRPGAKKIVVNFGDSVPHDCNLNEGVPGKTGTWSTGGDPGRDEIMGTADDLDLQTVLANMAANNIILLECHTSPYAMEYWEYWTNITGGGFYITTSGTLVDDVVNAITAGISTPHVYGLHLMASSGYESWVSSVPSVYPDLTTPATVNFTETICVPAGTVPGTYTFTVSAMDASNVSYGDQSVTITVPELIPELCPDEYRWNTSISPTGYEWDPYPTLFRAWNDVHFVNNGTVDAFNVTATITCAPVNVNIVDGTVTLGDIPAGSSAWSKDFFELEVDMTNPQGPDKGICWRVEYDDAYGNHHVIEDVAKYCGEKCSDICP